jgi:uncharacterized protein YecT (DUF1311 family)
VKRGLPTIALLLGLAGPVPASELPVACLEKVTPIGRVICFNDARDAADGRVATLLREAATPDLGLRGQDLVTAQDHWQRYRDLHCGLLDRDGEWNGSEAPADIAACRLAITLRRETELRALIEALRPR